MCNMTLQFLKRLPLKKIIFSIFYSDIYTLPYLTFILIIVEKYTEIYWKPPRTPLEYRPPYSKTNNKDIEYRFRGTTTTTPIAMARYMYSLINWQIQDIKRKYNTFKTVARARQQHTHHAQWKWVICFVLAK